MSSVRTSSVIDGSFNRAQITAVITSPTPAAAAEASSLDYTAVRGACAHLCVAVPFHLRTGHRDENLVWRDCGVKWVVARCT